MERATCLGLFELGELGLALRATAIREVVASPVSSLAAQSTTKHSMLWRGIRVPLVDALCPTDFVSSQDSANFVAIVQQGNRLVGVHVSRPLRVESLGESDPRHLLTVTFDDREFLFLDAGALFDGDYAIAPSADAVQAESRGWRVERQLILARMGDQGLALDTAYLAAVLPKTAVRPADLNLCGWSGTASYQRRTVYVSSTMAFWSEVETVCDGRALGETGKNSQLHEGAVVIIRDVDNYLALNVDEITATWSGTQLQLEQALQSRSDDEGIPTIIDLPGHGVHHLLDASLISRSPRLRGMAELGELHDISLSASHPIISVRGSTELPVSQKDNENTFLVFRYGSFVRAIAVSAVERLEGPVLAAELDGLDTSTPFVTSHGLAQSADSREKVGSAGIRILLRSRDHPARTVLATDVCRIVCATPWQLDGWGGIQAHRYISVHLDEGEVAARIMEVD